MLSRPVLAALACTVAGCTSGTTSLDDVSDGLLLVDVYEGTFGQPLAAPHFFVQLEPHQDDGGCIELTDTTTARVDDQTLATTSLGGFQTIDESVCTVPTFRLPDAAAAAMPKEPSTAIVLADGETEMRITASALFANRGIESAPPNGILARGATVTLRWTPATDAIDPGGLEVYFTPDKGPLAPAGNVAPSFLLSGGELTVDGSNVSFTVPKTAPVGHGKLTLYVNTAHVPSRCEGAARCDVSVNEAIRSIDATVE